MTTALYADGTTAHNIQYHLVSTIGMDESPDTISTVTDAVLDEVMVWQNRQIDEFEASELGHKYPQSVKVWQEVWERFIPILQFPPAARKVLYTTHSIESLNAELRKTARKRR